MREENKKLREELDKYKNGKVQHDDATVVTEDSGTSMEECTEIPLPKRKAVEHNGEGISKPKKTKTASMLHERQEEFERRVDLRISLIEAAMKTQVEAMNEIKDNMGAQIKELGTAIMQQITTVIQQQQTHQQQLDNFSTRVTELEKWASATGLQASGAAHTKEIPKPSHHTKPVILTPAVTTLTSAMDRRNKYTIWQWNCRSYENKKAIYTSILNAATDQILLSCKKCTVSPNCQVTSLSAVPKGRTKFLQP
ncbi:hypothetical protein HPB50_020812 [Hyalomma asiaticum]|uniref:Uncharacterized protein n=1 Tax=Hyalomma asiaticum TaxID=266040 RepID=A0ACB7S8P6_HYAAI|nr:hypothetical protein HPB50_020812 [Hyalomma asiaticum]